MGLETGVDSWKTCIPDSSREAAPVIPCPAILIFIGFIGYLLTDKMMAGRIWLRPRLMKVAEPREHFLTSSEVAALMGVTKRTIFNWLKCGKIPQPQRKPNGYFQWTLADVQLLRSFVEEMHSDKARHI
jgi:predicted DNA-binding transcriptional regulator AlpA